MEKEIKTSLEERKGQQVAVGCCRRSTPCQSALPAESAATAQRKHFHTGRPTQECVRAEASADPGLVAHESAQVEREDLDWTRLAQHPCTRHNAQRRPPHPPPATVAKLSLRWASARGIFNNALKNAESCTTRIHHHPLSAESSSRGRLRDSDGTRIGKANFEPPLLTHCGLDAAVQNGELLPRCLGFSWRRRRRAGRCVSFFRVS